jgi:hypothetical protein
MAWKTGAQDVRFLAESVAKIHRLTDGLGSCNNEGKVQDGPKGKVSRMSAKPKKTPAKQKKSDSGIHCCECNKRIQAREQALFVEEDVGRYFCEEACIIAHFTDDIEKMEREYGRHVVANDLTSEERERYAHFRWATLEEPAEVWMEKVPSGDHRYTLISQYTPDNKPVWGVAVCLMLRGEPSFLFIAFVTADKRLVDAFRKGERQKVVRQMKEDNNVIPLRPNDSNDQRMLAEGWSESDSVRAGIVSSRNPDDIPVEDFGFYQKCLEETLQEPTELWSFAGNTKKKVYHFIREYEHDQNYWYVVMAKDAEDETQIEIIDAFPTKDRHLVELCRHGKKEVFGGDQTTLDLGSNQDSGKKRMVH